MAKNDRIRIIGKVKQIVCSDRNEAYREPENSFDIIAQFWQTYLNGKTNSEAESIEISAADVGIMMALFKIARISSSNGKSEDSYIDLIGYGICAADCAEII